MTRKASQTSATSRPKNPNAGQAPIIRNETPTTKLTPASTPMTIAKPVELSERCGESRASNRTGSGNGLPFCIEAHYTGKMPATKKQNRARPAAGKKPRPKGSSRPWTKAEIEEAFTRFARANPEPKGELLHADPYTLLVAVVLSAQATDAGVNKATPALFAAAGTPEKMVVLGEEKVRDYVKTIGLYRTKARNVIALSEKLIAEHGGKVPGIREALEALPGVGRKTANVVLNIAFGEKTIAVDTHIFRVGNRTAMAPGLTPFEVEIKLNQIVPDKYKLHAHHWLILHGRYT